MKKTINNITNEEFDRAITLLKSNILMNRESNSSRARKNASNLLIENRIISVEEIVEELNKINIKKLQDLMQIILTKSIPSVAILGKLDKNLIDFENIKKIVNKG